MRRTSKLTSLSAFFLCLGFSAARAWDPNKPFIYEYKISVEMDRWLNCYSTTTVLSKSDNSVAFQVVANSTTTPTYQLVVTTQGNVGIGTASPAAQLDISGTGAIKLPLGTTAQRPANPAAGMARINTTTGRFEFYNGTTWIGLGFSAIGGTITDVSGYRIHTFTASGIFSVTGSGNVEVLVVAGGGGGGRWNGGGGGGGGYQYDASHAVTTGEYSVTVGAGGSGGMDGANSTSGENSVFDSITAVGGGLGGGNGTGSQASGGNGGSGGGVGGNTFGTGGTGSQGYNGGVANRSPNAYGAGGGGGAGADGGAGSSTIGGNGGNGITNSISGPSVTYAGGGGGGVNDTTTTPGTGGDGGGGAGSISGVSPTAGTANTGGGGGGGGGNAGAAAQDGASGGSGIVIIRYPW